MTIKDYDRGHKNRKIAKFMRGNELKNNVLS